MAQDRLWITDPRRATCLAEVLEVRGDLFRLDKALFAPRSTACRHPQNPDKGTVWLDGEKRRLAKVIDRDDVWYGLRGTVPPVGSTVQCQLDQDVRAEASRAHTAMHLWIAALPADAPPMSVSPEIRGGGHFRMTHAWPVTPDVLAAAVQSVRGAIAADTVVERSFVDRAVAMHSVTPQSFQPPEPVPGGAVLPLVAVGKVCLPCDGSHVDRTGRIESVQVRHAKMGKDGFVVSVRVT